MEKINLECKKSEAAISCRAYLKTGSTTQILRQIYVGFIQSEAEYDLLIYEETEKKEKNARNAALRKAIRKVF